MIYKLSTTLLCLFIVTNHFNCQYIPFPEADELDERPPYLNPSINDPLFYANHLVPCFKSLCNKLHYGRAAKLLGGGIYYDKRRNIYINIETGDYYDPATGLIYRKSTSAYSRPVNGNVGPNPISTNNPPDEESDKVYLPKKLKAYNRQYYEDSDEDCSGCDYTGKCEKCVKPQHNACGSCWEGKEHNKCGDCFNYQIVKNDIYKEMGIYIVGLLNKYRRQNDLNEVGFSKDLYTVALTQSLYMAHRGYLNNDNFLAHVATYDAGTMTTGYINGRMLSNQQGAEEFMSMWKRSPEHNQNLLSSKVNQCSAAVFYDEQEMKFYATLLCVKI